MKLENMMEMYRPRVSQERQVVYQVGDLESLSAGALYSGDKEGNFKFLDNGLVVPIKGLGIPLDRKSTRLNSSHTDISRMPSSA